MKAEVFRDEEGVLGSIGDTARSLPLADERSGASLRGVALEDDVALGFSTPSETVGLLSFIALRVPRAPFVRSVGALTSMMSLDRSSDVRPVMSIVSPSSGAGSGRLGLRVDGVLDRDFDAWGTGVAFPDPVTPSFDFFLLAGMTL